MTNKKYTDADIELLHREIIHRSTGRILIRPHLNRDWKIGLIGEAGDCKSVGGVKLTLRDFMFHGVKCYSNMYIKNTVEIPDDNVWCRYLGIPGGEVVYESEELDPTALFKLDERYRNCVIFADEINLELAEARRSGSNVNLNLNKVGQELRHLGAALVYTVINEMWVDTRIRLLTDVFIKTEDTALDADALLRKEIPGMQARWNLYPMSRKLNGTTHTEGMKPLGPYFIYVRDMWEAYDTLEMQASESLKYGSFLKQNKIITKPSENVVRQFDKWGFLEPLAEELLNRPEMYVPAKEYYNHPEVLKRGIPKHELSKVLNENYGIKAMVKKINGERISVYAIPEEIRSALV